MKHAEKYINGDSYNRSAGILLPVFSLPSPYGIGDMGEGAYRFVDMLREAGWTIRIVTAVRGIKNAKPAVCIVWAKLLQN